MIRTGNLQNKIAIANQIVKIYARNMTFRAPAKMEDFFKNKKFIVTGSGTG